jgi:hypothetical protein
MTRALVGPHDPCSRRAELQFGLQARLKSRPATARIEESIGCGSRCASPTEVPSENAAFMAEVRLLRRLAIGAAWLLATYVAPGAARAEPAPPSEATVCAVEQVEPAGFRLGTAAGTLGASSAIADFNHDGRPDVAIADRTGRTGASHRFRLQVEVSGLETVSLDVDSTESALSLSVADVDHDDDLDIVLSRPLSGETVGVWLNDGTGRFSFAPAGRFHNPARPLAGIGARAGDIVPVSPGLPSREFRSIVPLAALVADACDDARVLRGASQVFRPARFFPASRPRSPPAPSSLLS